MKVMLDDVEGVHLVGLARPLERKSEEEDVIHELRQTELRTSGTERVREGLRPSDYRVELARDRCLLGSVILVGQEDLVNRVAESKVDTLKSLFRPKTTGVLSSRRANVFSMMLTNSSAILRFSRFCMISLRFDPSSP